MKVIAFGASTSSTSINKALATYAANLIDNAEVTVLDLRDFDVPLYSEDKEKEIGQPEGAKQFLAALDAADALVISFAEHNGHYPAAFKNLFDWSTRIRQKVYGDTPAVYFSASPGPGGANSVLSAAETSSQFFGGDVKASLSVANFYDVFDMEEGKMKDPELDAKVKDAVSQLND